MRNAVAKVSVWSRSNEVKLKPLSNEEERFCDMILDGVPYWKAVLDSGVMPGVTDKTKLTDKGHNLMKTVRCRKYITEHQKTVRLLVEKDYDVLRVHMYEIAMGTAIRESEKITKDGEVVKITESPAFRDQIAAAAWIRQDLNDRKEEALRSPGEDIIVSDINEIDEKTNAFLAKYSFRPIETRSGSRLKAIEEAIDVKPDMVIDATVPRENITSESIQEAMDNEFRDYTIHS